MTTLAESKGLLKEILESQRFAVLATLNNRQPYSNLVAFAASDDLRYFIFATNRNTQKFHNILTDDKVALLIDNRSNSQSDFSVALAITALGTASEININNDTSEKLVQYYLSRHEVLADFLKGQETAIIHISVTEYIIARFDGAEHITVDDTF